MRAFAIVLLSVLAAVASVSVSALTLKDYRASRAEARTRAYLYGVGNGMAWANAEMFARQGGRALFCVPGHLVLTEENFVALLDSEIKSLQGSVREDDPVEPILLSALEKTFECK